MICLVLERNTHVQTAWAISSSESFPTQAATVAFLAGFIFIWTASHEVPVLLLTCLAAIGKIIGWRKWSANQYCYQFYLLCGERRFTNAPDTFALYGSWCTKATIHSSTAIRCFFWNFITTIVDPRFCRVQGSSFWSFNFVCTMGEITTTAKTSFWGLASCAHCNPRIFISFLDTFWYSNSHVVQRAQ